VWDRVGWRGDMPNGHAEVDWGGWPCVINPSGRHDEVLVSHKIQGRCGDEVELGFWLGIRFCNGLGSCKKCRLPRGYWDSAVGTGCA
jgi:hypothetical protein